MNEIDVDLIMRRPLFGWQLGLRQMLMVTFCAGVWFAHWTNLRRIAILEPRLSNLQSLSPELNIVDPNRVAIVQLNSPWFSIERWEVYIPTDKFRICVATEGIDQSGFPDTYASEPLPQGRYEIHFEEQQGASSFHYLVTRNGQSCFDIVTNTSPGSNGSSSGSGVSKRSLQFDVKVAIELIRRRYNVPVPGSPGSSQSPAVPSQGLLLWIQSTLLPTR